MDTDLEFAGDADLDTVSMIQWFSRHAGCAWMLVFTGRLPKVPASILSTALISQAASLRRLSIDVDVFIASRADFSALVALTRLETLSISQIGEPRISNGHDHCAAVVRTLARLPALKELPFSACVPLLMTLVEHELASLSSPSLQNLSCKPLRMEKETLVLGRLPKLVSCELDWDTEFTEEAVLRVTPASFAGAAAITRLHLRAAGQLDLAPQCFESLSNLVELSLKSSGFYKPTRVSCVRSAADPAAARPERQRRARPRPRLSQGLYEAGIPLPEWLWVESRTISSFKGAAHLAAARPQLQRRATDRQGRISTSPCSEDSEKAQSQNIFARTSLAASDSSSLPDGMAEAASGSACAAFFHVSILQYPSACNPRLMLQHQGLHVVTSVHARVHPKPCRHSGS